MNSQFSGSPQRASQLTTWPDEQLPRSRENPERIAWIVLLSSFGIFVLLAISTPIGVRALVRYATVRQEARLEPTQGTLLFYPSLTAEPIALTTPRDDIAEGSRRVASPDSTQGSLGLLSEDGQENIVGSVQMFPGATLDVLRLRRPFFERSPEPYQVTLRLEEGQARIFTNTGSGRPVRVELLTPHGDVTLSPGGYTVAVSPSQTELVVRTGQAELHHGSEAVVVEAGRRAWMTAEEVSLQTEPAEQNLVRNGDFSQPMLDNWSSYVFAENVIPGSVRIIERDGRRVAHFIRQGEENVPTEVGITQEINRDVNIYDDLSIQLDVRLMHQSLPGAGYLSSEFPLRVEVSYTDIYGKQLRWGHGFYFRDPEDLNWRVVEGEKIPPFSWYTYKSPNLMELLSETRPARIDSIRIYASGWNYQSMVSEVYLLAE